MGDLYRKDGMHCPKCGTQKVQAEEIPQSQIGYMDSDGTAAMEFLPKSEDCECLNCGARWLLFADEE